jgi:hypothetical protein
MFILARLVGVLALLGFALSMLVHGLTFTHVDVQAACPYVWTLHLGCFVVFIPMIIASRREFRGKAPVSELRAVLPKWADTVLTCIFMYAIVNFVLFFFLSEGGSAAQKDGAFILQSHGTFVRQLSEAEFHAHKNYVVRGFSGHWLVFYLVPALYFLFRLPRPADRAKSVQ